MKNEDSLLEANKEDFLNSQIILEDTNVNRKFSSGAQKPRPSSVSAKKDQVNETSNSAKTAQFLNHKETGTNESVREKSESGSIKGEVAPDLRSSSLYEGEKEQLEQKLDV